MNKIYLSWYVLWFMLLHNLSQSLALSRYPESEDWLQPGVVRLAFELIWRKSFCLKTWGLLRNALGKQEPLTPHLTYTV